MKKSFQELIKGSEKAVLVDFYADWCGPCKALSPVLKTFSDTNQDKVKVIKVNVDKNPKAAEVYRVKGVPTLLLFKNGQTIWRQSGAPSLPQLNAAILPYLN